MTARQITTPYRPLVGDAKSNPLTQSDIAEILHQLASAKAVFQQRTIVAIITEGEP